MDLLLDTHILLWAALTPRRLSEPARGLILSDANRLVFSAVSIWEVTVKTALDRPDFQVDARQLRRGLLSHDYTELSITSDHAASVAGLPPIHRDPFDRMLIAQAMAEGLLLITADATLARYPGPVRLV